MRTYSLFVCLLVASTFLNCTAPTPEMPKDEFLELSGNPSLDKFVESEMESKDYTVRRFNNISLTEFVDLNNVKGEIVIQYTAVAKTGDKPMQTKTILESNEKSGRLAVVDLVSGKAVWEKEFPKVDTKTDSLTVQKFNSLQACIDDFMCKNQCELEALANKKCETQFAALTCCLSNGQCFSVHLVFPPTSIRCLIRPPFDFPVNFKGVILSK